MIPNGQFYLSQANTEFGGGGYASTILTTAGVPAPRLLSALMGKSAFTPTHQLTVGTSQNNSWGWNSTTSPAYGNLDPKTSGAVTWIYFYVSTTKLMLSPSSIRLTATFKLTFDNGATVTIQYNSLAASKVIGGDESACVAKIRQSAGKTIGVSFERIA